MLLQALKTSTHSSRADIDRHHQNHNDDHDSRHNGEGMDAGDDEDDAEGADGDVDVEDMQSRPNTIRRSVGKKLRLADY